jgi:hypothetical protein
MLLFLERRMAQAGVSESLEPRMEYRNYATAIRRMATTDGEKTLRTTGAVQSVFRNSIASANSRRKSADSG